MQSYIYSKELSNFFVNYELLIKPKVFCNAMLFYPLLFGAGLLCVQQFSNLPSIYVLIALLTLAALLIFFKIWKGLLFTLGIIWGITFATWQLNDRLTENLEDKTLSIIGIIDSLPEQNSQRAHFEFVITQSVDVLPKRVKLSWYEPTATLKAGQMWKFSVRLKRPHALYNLGSQDYERWLFLQGIGATGHIQTKVKPVLLKDSAFLFHFNSVRQIITNRLSDVLGNSETVGLIKALTLGDDNQISAVQWDVFQKTGITHLVVISGSHIGLIAGLIYSLVFFLYLHTKNLRFTPSQVAAVASLIGGFLYCGLAGLIIPAKRAVIMLTIALCATIFQRHVKHSHIFSIALFAILIIEPLAVLSIGFWLSFCAVALILYTTDARLLPASKLHNLIIIQFVVSIGLAPILVFYFQQVSIVAPFVNFIAVPIVELLLVPLSLLMIPLVFVSADLANLLLKLLDNIVYVLNLTLHYAAQLPFSVINHPEPTFFAFILAILGILLLFAPRGIPMRCAGLLLVFPLLFNQPEKLNKGEMRLTLLDVGQGLAIVVQTQHHVLIYDTGAKFNENDMGKKVVLPFLRYQNITKIDTLLISHNDNDHSGGAESILNHVFVERVLTSAPEKFDAYSAQLCQKGQTWAWDDVIFTILSPHENLFEADNNNSCVLQIQTSDKKALLTGDIEAVVEHQLIENEGENLKAQVLIAPHHGSKTSSTMDFLQIVQPEFILISAGYHNQFHHPNKIIVERYKNQHSAIFNTANEGEIDVLFTKNTIKINSLRATQKYWNAR